MPVGATAVEGPGDSAQGPLTWEARPTGARPGLLPEDRVLTGRLRNRSGAPLTLDATAVRLLDDAGTAVEGTVSFAAGFSHGLHGAGAGPQEPMPDFQARRLGVRTVVEPGSGVPFTVSWRGGTPTRVVLEDVTVALPAVG